MSHELTNSAQQYVNTVAAAGREYGGALTPRQVQFAETIHSSGNDLLLLINDILDLTKIESGMMAIEAARCRLTISPSR